MHHNGTNVSHKMYHFTARWLYQFPVINKGGAWSWVVVTQFYFESFMKCAEKHLYHSSGLLSQWALIEANPYPILNAEWFLVVAVNVMYVCAKPIQGNSRTILKSTSVDSGTFHLLMFIVPLLPHIYASDGTGVRGKLRSPVSLSHILSLPLASRHASPTGFPERHLGVSEPDRLPANAQQTLA